MLNTLEPINFMCDTHIWLLGVVYLDSISASPYHKINPHLHGIGYQAKVCKSSTTVA